MTMGQNEPKSRDEQPQDESHLRDGPDVALTAAAAALSASSIVKSLQVDRPRLDYSALFPSASSIVKSLQVGRPARVGTKHLLFGSQFGSAFGTSASASTYLTATRTLLDSLNIRGFDAESAMFDVEPTFDSSAYQAIARASPEIAKAIDDAAILVRTPFWSREIVRNTHAWLLMTLVVAAYVAGAVLPPPWDQVVLTVLGIGGVSAPAAYRKVATTTPVAQSEHPRLDDN